MSKASKISMQELVFIKVAELKDEASPTRTTSKIFSKFWITALVSHIF